MPYRCPICGRMFTKFYALKVHFVTEHYNDGVETTCPCCGRKVKSLSKHTARHNDLCHRVLHGLLCRNRNGYTRLSRERCKDDYRLAAEALYVPDEWVDERVV